MSDLRLLSKLRVLPDIKNPSDVEKYLKTENRQNLKAVEDGFRRTHNNNTARIADNAARIADIAAINTRFLNYALSASCGSFFTTSNSDTDITNLSVTLTNTRGPIVIVPQPDGNTVSSANVVVDNAGFGCLLKIFRNGSLLTHFEVQRYAFTVPPGGFQYIDFSVITSPGTYTYKLVVENAGSSSFIMNFCKLLAYELRG